MIAVAFKGNFAAAVLDPPTLENQKLRMDVKHMIARKAAALVEDGDIIYIDAGTTTSAMTRYLENKKITVVTPSLEVLQQLPVKGVSFVVVGGELNFELASFCGPIAEKILSQMYFDKAFLSVSAYSDYGVFANDIREGRKKEIVKEHSSETYVLADRTKQQQWGFMQVMDRSECTIITEKDDEDPEIKKEAKAEDSGEG
ncbi:MAG: DeoR/GlpR family DNA-binding transcription regulator [Marvinbryantia sp.]|uniref:DeoR/GlpR family DNA-binding transcription regulator n=1 Tax=Marvinbryantia sp. TaxID=2496532 RepID=UPI0025CC4621|nr:DeoR/GlpR transcriptional regulator [uncultured Marvinbryantia sp.]